MAKTSWTFITQAGLQNTLTHLCYILMDCSRTENFLRCLYKLKVVQYVQEVFTNFILDKVCEASHLEHYIDHEYHKDYVYYIDVYNVNKFWLSGLSTRECM